MNIKNILYKLIQLSFIMLISLSDLAAQVSKETELSTIDRELQQLEKKFHLKIGAYVLDTNSGEAISYHANDIFPFQSTFKFMAAAALLYKDNNKPLLKKKIFISPTDLISWHPISGQYVNKKVELEALAKGAVSFSDNTAVNLIVKELGGIKAVNHFAQRIGNRSFNLQHLEINLNSSPNLNVDTSTPKDMAYSVQKILLGNVLSKANRNLLVSWMRDNTTGYNRIRAGVPLGWMVADKTGTGSYGIANDIGIAWSPNCKPVVFSIFTVKKDAKAAANDLIIKKITQLAFKHFSTLDACFTID